MSKLYEEMVKRQINPYKIIKFLGLKMNTHYVVSQRIKGEKKILPKDLEEYCRAISSLSNQPINAEDVDKEATEYKLM